MNQICCRICCQQQSIRKRKDHFWNRLHKITTHKLDVFQKRIGSWKHSFFPLLSAFTLQKKGRHLSKLWAISVSRINFSQVFLILFFLNFIKKQRIEGKIEQIEMWHDRETNLENFDLVFLLQIQPHLKGKSKEPRLMLSNEIFLENNMRLHKITANFILCSITYSIYT